MTDAARHPVRKCANCRRGCQWAEFHGVGAYERCDECGCCYACCYCRLVPAPTPRQLRMEMDE